MTDKVSNSEFGLGFVDLYVVFGSLRLELVGVIRGSTAETRVFEYMSLLRYPSHLL